VPEAKGTWEGLMDFSFRAEATICASLCITLTVIEVRC
jgi:hypothetical protein